MWLLLAALGCGGPSASAYMQTEAGFLRVGVDRTAELVEVKRVLAQRGLSVVSERASFACIAVGAESENQAKTAIRVISSRGVVFAQDAALDDLFAPSHLELVESLPESIGDMELFAFARIPKGHALGCVTVGRVLRDGTAVPVALDVRLLGERACVGSVRHAGGGKLLATVTWPELSAPDAPATLDVLLGFDRGRLDQAAPLLRHARVQSSPELLNRETKRLASVPAHASFGDRQALAVGRAALAQLRGDDKDAQLGVYREGLGAVRAGSYEARMAEETAAHILRGWLDTRAADAHPDAPGSVPQLSDDDVFVIEPEGSVQPDGSDSLAPPVEDH
jgi:hypothetical protein